MNKLREKMNACRYRYVLLRDLLKCAQGQRPEQRKIRGQIMARMNKERYAMIQAAQALRARLCWQGFHKARKLKLTIEVENVSN